MRTFAGRARAALNKWELLVNFLSEHPTLTLVPDGLVPQISEGVFADPDRDDCDSDVSEMSDCET